MEIIRTNFSEPEEYLKTLSELNLTQPYNTYKKVLEICTKVKDKGGRALLVGGSVRDYLLGIITKDYDLEVYGLSPKTVEQIVKFSGKVSEVGRAFGILKIFTEDGLDIDISLPRKDSKIGSGHKGFEVKTDPHMSIKEAAKRRDFTINSIAADPLTGKLYDPFNGILDISNKILRITDSERFKDDPLRVLRGVQFVGRFNLTIEPETLTIMKGMVPELKELPKERINEEWKKLLLKSQKPSIGLQAALEIGILEDLHPEFIQLVQTEQEPLWHPEGNVWNHTLMTLDAAAEMVRKLDLDDNQGFVILLAALCHDLGKPYVTEFRDNFIKSHGHEKAGEKPALHFLNTIGVDNLTKDKVVNLVANHLSPSMLYIEDVLKGNKISDGAIRRLARRIHPATIKELLLVSEADHLGRGPFPDETKEHLTLPVDDFPAKEWLLKRARKLEIEDRKPKDITQGRDWLKLGFEPGPDIGELINISNELRYEKNYSKSVILESVKDLNDSQAAIVKLNSILNDHELQS